MKPEEPWKAEVYGRCLEEIAGRVENRTVVERMGIVCRVLKENFPYYFWVGFYFLREILWNLAPR